MQSSYVVLALLAAGLATTASVGCGQKKVTECNNLIKVINTGVQSLEKGSKATSDPSGVEELKSMADAMDKVAEDAGKLELSIDELKKFSADYQAMAKEVSGAAREMATAAGDKDAKKITDAQEKMEKAVKNEDPLVDEINKYCQEP